MSTTVSAALKCPTQSAFSAVTSATHVTLLQKGIVWMDKQAIRAIFKCELLNFLRSELFFWHVVRMQLKTHSSSMQCCGLHQAPFS